MTFKYPKTIADIIHEHKTREQEVSKLLQPAFDTTTENDAAWDEEYKPSTERTKEYIPKKQR